MIQTTICYKVLNVTKYYILQSTKSSTKYRILLQVTKYSMFLHGKLLWITRFIFSSKKVETLRLCTTSRNFFLNHYSVEEFFWLDLSNWYVVCNRYPFGHLNKSFEGIDCVCFKQLIVSSFIDGILFISTALFWISVNLISISNMFLIYFQKKKKNNN